MGEHDHDHTQPHTSRLVIAFAITAGILLAEMIGAVLTGSLALVVDAGHMLTDAGGLGLALLGGEPKVTEVDLPVMPMIVLVLDELAELLAGGISREERARDDRIASRLRLLVAKGRAAGIVPVLATQKPSSDVIPTAIRDLIRERVAFACSTPGMVDTVLGGGAAKRAAAQELRHDLPGVCSLLAEDDREPVRARAYWLDREQARRIAEATEDLRVDIPGIGDGFRVGAERPIE